jgi:catechol 2,3-dioxygenase-like lactoylglutathione lyase family enzyme
MHVRRLQWVGSRADDLPAMAALYRDVLGLRQVVDDGTTAKFELPDGGEMQAFGPGHADYTFLVEHGFSGPVPMFEVDDLDGAFVELQSAGLEIIGEGIYSDDAWRWVHFRAPDGNLYELATRRT